jgi:hypothetical protein
MSKRSRGIAKSVNIGRHKRNCTVCAHPQCCEIESDFVNWGSAAELTREYGLADRASIYRHAHAFGLLEKRKRNVAAALEKIIERAGYVDVTSSSVVAAVQAYAKINSQGQWIERGERINLNELFARMSREELEVYASHGTLPDWFQPTASATRSNSEGEENA